MYNTKEMQQTIKTLEDDVKKKLPVYVKVIMNDGDAVYYPIKSIGTNQKCVVIAVYDKDMKLTTKETDEDDVWLERVQR